jgi:hypothetical protein
MSTMTENNEATIHTEGCVGIGYDPSGFLHFDVLWLCVCRISEAEIEVEPLAASCGTACLSMQPNTSSVQ